MDYYLNYLLNYLLAKIHIILFDGSTLKIEPGSWLRMQAFCHCNSNDKTHLTRYNRKSAQNLT